MNRLYLDLLNFLHMLSRINCIRPNFRIGYPSNSGPVHLLRQKINLSLLFQWLPNVKNWFFFIQIIRGIYFVISPHQGGNKKIQIMGENWKWKKVGGKRGKKREKREGNGRKGKKGDKGSKSGVKETMGRIRNGLKSSGGNDFLTKYVPLQMIQIWFLNFFHKKIHIKRKLRHLILSS